MRYICMAVYSRLNIVQYLKMHIPNLEIVLDEFKSLRLNWFKALTCIGKDAAVVVEDDIALAKEFVKKTQLAINSKPSELIQFHSRAKADVTVGSRYRPGSSFLNNQAVYYPPGMAEAVLKFSLTSNIWDKHPNGSDCAIALFMQTNKMRYWNHVPSLAEHLSVVSAVDPRRSRHRQSTTFVDPETDGLNVDLLLTKKTARTEDS